MIIEVNWVRIEIYRNLQLERTIIFILNSSVAWQALHHVSSYAKWVSVQKFWKLFGFRFKSHEKDDKGKKVEFSCLSFIVVLHYYLLWCPCRPILGFSIDQESSFDWITQFSIITLISSVMWWILKLGFANYDFSANQEKNLVITYIKVALNGICSRLSGLVGIR